MGEVISSPSGDFYVEQSGPRQGPSVVFVAGLGDDHASWDAVTALLAESFHCVTFDNRGIGASDVTAGPYSIQGLAADVEAIATALDLGVVDVVGSSMGGAICQEWALSRPERIGRIVLTNTWARRDAWFSALMDHWIDLVERGAGDDVLYQLALFCYSPGYISGHPDTISEFLDSGPLNPLGFVGAARACQTHDALDRLENIHHETLVIGGKADILTRPELSVELARRLPHAQLEWLSAGHMTFWEEPTVWAELVHAFLGTGILHK